MDSSDSSYYSRQQLDELFLQMIAFFSGDPKRIQHFMKVHSFARIIGTKEGLDETSLFILEAAAYTHGRWRDSCIQWFPTESNWNGSRFKVLLK